MNLELPLALNVSMRGGGSKMINWTYELVMGIANEHILSLQWHCCFSQLEGISNENLHVVRCKHSFSGAINCYLIRNFHYRD